MEDIDVKEVEKFPEAVFKVSVGKGNDKTEHTVCLDKTYYEKTGTKIAPIELIRRSFDFLLTQEPKESILREFNLRIISNYFPQYEKEVMGVQ